MLNIHSVYGRRIPLSVTDVVARIPSLYSGGSRFDTWPSDCDEQIFFCIPSFPFDKYYDISLKHVTQNWIFLGCDV
jgi:hypothetical protein